jgi:hypothetical protein
MTLKSHQLLHELFLIHHNTGQTGPAFKTRFKEHVRVMKNNGQNSKFAQHILDTARGSVVG